VTDTPRVRRRLRLAWEVLEHADQESALDLTAVGLVLSLGASTLLLIVVSQRRPQTASGPEELPARGGSST